MIVMVYLPPPPLVPPPASRHLVQQVHQAEIDMLQRRISELKSEVAYRRKATTFATIAEASQLVAMYTGLPSAEMFRALVSYLPMTTSVA